MAVICSPTSVIELLVEKDVHKLREDGGEEALDIAENDECWNVVKLLESQGITLDGSWRESKKGFVVHLP